MRGFADALIFASHRTHHRSTRIAAIVVCLLAFPTAGRGASRVLFHATLLRSTPAANSHLTKPPETLRLVFSEAIVPDLSHITLTGEDGKALPLRVATDPRDTRTLVGTFTSIQAGRYKVAWHVLSADGHSSGGTFSFTVEAPAVGMASPASEIAASSTKPGVVSTPIDTSSAAAASATTEEKSIPILASVLRGLGLGATMAGVGLLFFGVTSRDSRDHRPSALVVRLIAIGAILLIAHLGVWLRDVSPDGSLGGDFVRSALGSTPGDIEVIRIALAVLTLCAVGLARQGTIGLALGIACLAVSGASGHPAAIHPLWSIPFKAVHLLAGAAWLGGLLWLATARRDDASFPLEARRVSSAALICAMAILLSGTLQTVMFLNTPGDLIHSAYGRLALIKMIGVLALIGLGAFNRFILLPVVDESDARPALTRTVRQEIAIVIVLILIGGFLAYVPTPSPTTSVSRTATATAQVVSR
jgi:copper transport protein